MEKFITLTHLKKALQSLIVKFSREIESLPKVAKTGNYNDLTNKPNLNTLGDNIYSAISHEIPRDISELNNDTGYITSTDITDFMIRGIDYVTAGQQPGTTLGQEATAEGSQTTASGGCSHAEGNGTTASGNYSHAEGNGTKAINDYSHAEGYYTTASGVSTHAEGTEVTASGNNSHAEGYRTTASGNSSHTEGNVTTASGNCSHAEGSSFQINITINGPADATTYTVELPNTLRLGKISATDANNFIKECFIYYNGEKFPLTGCTIDNTGLLTSFTTTTTLSNTRISRTIVQITNPTKAIGDYSHAEGYGTTAVGLYSHAEGNYTTAAGGNSHAENYGTTASGNNSHAEGYNTTASGASSHAEGGYTTASGNYSHAEGYYTIAQRRSQHVFGEYNALDTFEVDGTEKGAYIEIVGNGTSASNRSNARTLDWGGNETLAGKLTLGSAPTANMHAATKGYVDTAISNIVDANTTYSLSISGNVITLTGSDNTTSSVTLPVYNGGVN